MFVTTVLYTWIIPVQLRQVHIPATPSLPAPTNRSADTRSTNANSRLIGCTRACTGSVGRKQRAIGFRAGWGTVIGRRHGAWIMACKRTESRRNHCSMQPHNLLDGISSKNNPFIGTRYTPPGKSPPPCFSVVTLFRFVARFPRVRIEDSSRNRFASTAYFANPGTFRGEFSGGGIFLSRCFKLFSTPFRPYQLHQTAFIC